MRRGEVKAHFNLKTGGYSVHDGKRVVVTDAPAMLLFRASGEVGKAANKRFLDSRETFDIDRVWLLVEDRGRLRCVPRPERLPTPVRSKPMGLRSVYAHVVGTPSSEEELDQAMRDAKAGRGGWRAGGFWPDGGCFFLFDEDGKMRCIPEDRSVDVLLASQPNEWRRGSPLPNERLCQPLYRPRKDAKGIARWQTPLAIGPLMFVRPSR